MNSIIKQTSDRIRTGVAEMEDLVHRVKEGWVRAERSGDTYYLDGVALNLHGLYSATLGQSLWPLLIF